VPSLWLRRQQQGLLQQALRGHRREQEGRQVARRERVAECVSSPGAGSRGPTQGPVSGARMASLQQMRQTIESRQAALEAEKQAILGLLRRT